VGIKVDPKRDDTRVVPGESIPWAELAPGIEIKMLRAGAADDRYVFMNRFAPGFTAPKHLHLGDVHGYTFQGRWHYFEYDWHAKAGDYIFEPAGTIHTLHVPEDNTGPTIVLFVVDKGLDLYDGEGRVFMTQDAKTIDALYRAALAAKGIEYPKQVLP
jgi:anti-sigma factor ChrR (cupin superfamily)